MYEFITCNLPSTARHEDNLERAHMLLLALLHI